MKLGVAIVGAVIVIKATSLHAETKDAYICIDQLSTGYSKENGKYVQKQFTLGRFTIVKEKSSIIIKENENEDYFDCVDPLDEKSNFTNSKIMCTNLFTHLAIDLRTLNYSRAKMFPSSNDSQVISIGSCQKF